MTNNKKDLKEAPMQSIPTPKSILNYKDDEVVAALKKEIGKNKDYNILRITHQANQYYNVVISWIIPDEDWSFELDKYRYIQSLHKYRIELFTELSKVLPVVNVNLLAFDFVKGNEELKFCLTILLSDTNNKDWVTGRRKQTIDQRERMKLLQTEAKKPKKIDPEKQQEQAKDSALEKLIGIIEKAYKGIKNEGEFLKFYTIITGRRKPRGYNADGWFKDYESQAREEIKTSIEWIHDIEEAKTIIQKMVKYGIMKPVIKEGVELDYEFAPSTVPGTPTTDEDFLEHDSNTKMFPVKESELIEGKLYTLFESNGLIIDTVQYLRRQEDKYLFEKSATGRKIKLNKNDVLNCIKKMKKKVIKEGWKMRDEIQVDDAFAAAEKARTIQGVLSANAITQDKLVVTYDGRKIDGDSLKMKISGIE